MYIYTVHFIKVYSWASKVGSLENSATFPRCLFWVCLYLVVLLD